MQTMDRPGQGDGSADVVRPVNKRRAPAPWPVAFWRSAVGKKWVMALTAIMLMGYVFFHMVGNLKMYQGAHALNTYGEFLRELLYPLFPRTFTLWMLRLGLIAAFALHILASVQLTVMNRRSNAGSYSAKRDWQAASVASRSMRWTGLVITLFLLWHLADFTWGWVNPDFVRGDVYRNVSASLTNAVPAAIYIVANVALGVHLWHGAWSMFQTMGLNNPRYNSWRKGFAIGFAVLIAVGNLSFPIAMVSGAVEDDDCYEDGDRIVTCEAVFSEALEAGQITVEQFDSLSDSERHDIVKANEARESLEVQEAGQ